jgi:hypothetical protein
VYPSYSTASSIQQRPKHPRPPSNWETEEVNESSREDIVQRANVEAVRCRKTGDVLQDESGVARYSVPHLGHQVHPHFFLPRSYAEVLCAIEPIASKQIKLAKFSTSSTAQYSAANHRRNVLFINSPRIATF